MIINVLLSALGVYLATGVLFALIFLISGGAKKIDPGAEEGTFGFRLMIFPGCTIFWPLLLTRWKKAGLDQAGPLPVEKSAHRTRH